jgi:hypothetical protein
MVLGHKLVELAERAEKHLFDLPGVAPQHATHLHALTCAGLHERLDGLRGKVHVGARGSPGAGGKTGVWARTARRTSTGAGY